jgi:ribonuclease HI
MISIYVDGSCLENQNVDQNTPAAWGLVVVSGDNGLGKGNGEIVEELFGNVVTSPSDKKYLGAAVGSNNTAELSGFAEALRWLLIEGSDIPAVIRTDSLYAGNLATGKWKPKANKKLVESLQKLWIEVSSIRDVEWEHVKAHRGHRWNERADHLALRCAQGTSPIPLSFWKPGQR